MSGRIRGESESEAFGLIAQRVAHHAGFDQGGPSLGIELDDAIAARRHIEHDSMVHRLPAHRRAAAPDEDGRAMLLADKHAGGKLLQRGGHHDADRHLPVVRRVRRIHRAVPVIKPHGSA
ncbi:hypothetical protein D3C71_1045400 [compost metagenome]